MRWRGSRKFSGFAGDRRSLYGRHGGGFGRRCGSNRGRLRSFGGARGLDRRYRNYWSSGLGCGCRNFRNHNGWSDRGNRRLNNYHGHCGRDNSDGRARRSCCTCRSLGDHRFSRRPGRNGRGRWRRNDNLRRRAWLGNDLARLGLDRFRGRRNGYCYGRHWAHWRLWRWRLNRTPQRQTALSRLGFFFLFLG
jgi:hypothetical protein